MPRVRTAGLASVADGRARVFIEHVTPQVDNARFPIKRVAGEQIEVGADVFADGHDVIRALVRHRRTPFGRDARPGPWRELDLVPRGNDLWTATLDLPEEGWWEYQVAAWIDRFESWRDEIRKKHGAGLDVSSELVEGAQLIRERAGLARGAAVRRLQGAADQVDGPAGQAERVAAALDDALAADMAAADDRRERVESPTYRARVERVRARTGAWYEMFPRSETPDPSRSATFREAEARLPAIAAMGFDVLYLPPIHPIGRRNRKGRNNALVAAEADPGSPWAIGAAEGGHTAVDPGLGTLEDFDAFREAAAREGLEIALDLAFQCAPDHPWVTEHPEWFRHRPDGSIKYAENPPKKYQDIYPIDFDTDAWPALWEALRDVTAFWAARGVRIFRVDNPHTKSFRFWEWMIADVQQTYPDTIFLAEAFTRPKIMRRLAKLGFSQSYTYFTWRNAADELREYFTELTQTEVREYLRPNLFANTPDILHAYLQQGGRPAFQVRLVLAATLGATYGIYSGFELSENAAVRAGSEEYLDSEKYQVKPRVWDQPGSLAPLVAQVNRIRHENPALHGDWSLRFHPTDNPHLLAYSKASPDGANRILVVVNLDPHRMQHGFLTLSVDPWGLPIGGFAAHDLLSGDRFLWRGDRHYVRLDPAERVPAHILRLEEPTA